MTGLITQPYRRPNRVDEDNYLVTLSSEFDLRRHVEEAGISASVDLSGFYGAHPTGRARLWAVRDTRIGRSVWSKTSAGDLVLFYGYGAVYAYGFVGSKFVIPDNNSIWPSGSQWDLVYSLSDFRELPEGRRLEYKSLRELTKKLGTQSVGFHDLDALGLTTQDVLDFVENYGPRHKSGSPLLRGVDRPPLVGESFPNRVAIWEAFGGHQQYGMTEFEHDEVVNVFSHDGSPYGDSIDADSGLIHHQGQGLTGNQRMTGVNELLDKQRREGQAVRYWTGPKGGPFVFRTWAIPVDVDYVEATDSEGAPVKRFVWFLRPVQGPEQTTWPKDSLVGAFTDDWDVEQSQDETESNDASSFADRYAAAKPSKEESSEPPPKSQRPSTQFKRSRKLRKLIVERAQGRCENPSCTGMPGDIGTSGQPLLDVDHLQDLGNGGKDETSNMVALCPNCHRAKTHGSKRARLKSKLQRIVAEKERVLAEEASSQHKFP